MLFSGRENVLLARQKEKLLSVKQKTVDRFYSPSKQTLLLLRRLSLIMLVSDGTDPSPSDDATLQRR